MRVKGEAPQPWHRLFKSAKLRPRQAAFPAGSSTLMPLVTSDALVLRTYKLGETSKLVVLLTRERGKQRAVAKGARGGKPRYQSALEPLSEVRVTLHGRQGTELFRLGACELLRSAFRTGERDLDASLALSYFAELLDSFSQEGEAEDAVYRLAQSVMRAASSGTKVAVLARYLEAWLLRLHGIYPPLDRCASCHRPLAEGARVYHDGARGFVCEGCGPASGPVLSAVTVAFLSEVFRRPPQAISGGVPDGESLEAFHRGLIAAHLERDLRSYRVMRDVARETRRAGSSS
jgi:DNA repair protein RecO (recombination protein O)